LVKSKSHVSEKVQEVIDFVRKSGGIEYTRQVMMDYFEQSVAALSDFEDSVFKNSLINLVKFTVEREK
jgi:octaprenyl-diphosphate synthase